MNKVSIVLTGSGKCEYKKDFGGIQLAELSFCDYAAEFTDNYFFSVYCSGEKDCVFANDHGVNINFLQAPQIDSGGIFKTWSFSQKLRDKLTGKVLGGEDVLHFTSIGPAMTMVTDDFIFYKKSQKFNTKLVYTLHNFHYGIANRPYDIFSEYPVEWYFLHQKERYLINNSDSVIVTSNRLSKYLSNIMEREITYIPNTIGKLSDYPIKKISAETTNPKLMTLCRFAGEKNLIRSVRAFKILLAHYPKATWFIGGYGEMRDDLINEIHRSKINLYHQGIASVKENGLPTTGGIVMLGQVNDQDKLWIFNLCNIYFQTSLREVSPLVGLEAMAYGKIIVASNIPGWSDFHDAGAVVYLADPLDIGDIFLQLIKACKLVINDSNKQYVEINRLTYSKNYAPDVVVKKRIHIYDNLLATQ